MPELPAVRPCSDVRDDVDLLVSLVERPLDRQVVATRDDQLVRRAALPEQRGEAREEPVDRLRLDRGLEVPVELVVERAGAVHRRDVLRHAREVERTLARVLERRRKLGRKVARAVETEHRERHGRRRWP